MEPLHFVSSVQKDAVKVTADEVYSEVKRWDNAMVGFVCEKSPPFSSMEEFISCNWKKYSDVKLHQLDSGVFVFQFENVESKQWVLNHDPSMFKDKYLVLRPWSREMDLEKKPVCTWIKLPYLKLHLWSPQILSKIASEIGTPLCMDKQTATRERLSYARIYVEIDAYKRHPNYVTIKDEKTGDIYSQKVVYEWLPQTSDLCRLPAIRICSVQPVSECPMR